MATRTSRVCFRLRRSFTMGYPVFEIWGADEEIAPQALEHGDIHVYPLPRPAERVDIDTLLAQLRPLAKAMMRGAAREFIHGGMTFRLTADAIAASACMASLCRHAPERADLPVDLPRLALRARAPEAAPRAQA